MELNVHLLASIPNAAWAEQMGLLDDFWVTPPRIAGGVLFAPETPGHGLSFRPEVLKDFAVRSPVGAQVFGQGEPRGGSAPSNRSDT